MVGRSRTAELLRVLLFIVGLALVASAAGVALNVFSRGNSVAAIEGR